MKRLDSNRLMVLLIGVMFIVSGVSVHKSSAQGVPPELFSGERRVFVANGYSTTRNWPAVLQRKIDRYYDGQRVIEVVNTYRSGTPIAKWIDVNTGERLSKWKKYLQPVLEEENQSPVIVLAQQSLQWVFSEDRLVGIEGAQDVSRIEQGADAIELYTTLAKEDGADLVFLATHIYKMGSEPQIENEKYALEAVLAREIDGLYRGPDVWTPTSINFPIAFARDLIHPNQVGDEIMAHFWFTRLLEFDGKPVPAWSKVEMDEAIIEGGGEIEENLAPTAVIQIDRRSGPAPLQITFDGSGSSDSDGILVAYDWNFSDGTNDASEVVEHTFELPGEYEVTLTVVDDIGDSDVASVLITVSQSEEPIVYGDVTGDGNISALDASEVLKHAAGITALNEVERRIADVSGNGEVSALDASFILRQVVGIIDCFPVDTACVSN